MAEEQERQRNADAAVAAREERSLKRREARRTQTYRTFVRQLAGIGGISEDLAERAASSVLCALEMRLVAGEGQNLADQLPQRLQEMLWRCERHENEKPLRLDRNGFLELVAGDLSLANRDAAEPIVRAVFTACRALISEGEAESVMDELPEDLRALWQRPV